MRFPALAFLAMVTVSVATPAMAQTYDPSYPVCMQVYGRVGYYDCRYESLAQCAVSASGRSALCMFNPYAANAVREPSVRHYRRHQG
jgi:hypothetical protein